MRDTWQCGECETVNPRGAPACQACLSPAPAAPWKTPSTVAGAPVAGRVTSGKTPWTCPGCETVNAASSIACTACKQPMPSPKPRRPSPKPRRTPKPARAPGSPRPGSPTGPSPFRPPPPRAGSPSPEAPLPGIGLTGLSDPSRFFAPGTGTPPSAPPKPREPRRAPRIPPPTPPADGSPSPGPAPGPAWDSPPPPPKSPPAPGHREPWTPPPPYRRARRRPGKLIGFLLLLAVAAGAFLTRGDWLPVIHHITASGTPAASPTGPPCPAGIAATIKGGENSKLIGAYNSPKFKIRLCETSTGKIYYHGSDRNNPSLHITLPAQRSRHGYKAKDNGYVYYVSKRRLVITKNGVKILDERLRPVS